MQTVENNPLHGTRLLDRDTLSATAQFQDYLDLLTQTVNDLVNGAVLFKGNWQQGMTYTKNSVVIHGSLVMMAAVNTLNEPTLASPDWLLIEDFT